jgi:hypothetical protein
MSEEGSMGPNTIMIIGQLQGRLEGLAAGQARIEGAVQSLSTTVSTIAAAQSAIKVDVDAKDKDHKKDLKLLALFGIGSGTTGAAIKHLLEKLF